MLIGQHQTHPAADAFPLMDDAALKGLVESIKAYGQWLPIVLLDGMVLDGRNRYLACLQAGVEPKFTDYAGPQDKDSVAGYVAIMNLDRRDLTPGGRALSARRLGALIRERKPRNQPALPGTEADHASDVVLGDGTPELIEAVERGDVPIELAVEVAKHEPEQQRRLIEKLRDAPKPTVKDSRHMTVSFELTGADVAALQALLHHAEGSKHGIVKAGAMLVRKMAGV
jgi:ParB-like chromosome segregation protein Spo0J